MQQRHGAGGTAANSIPATATGNTGIKDRSEAAANGKREMLGLYLQRKNEKPIRGRFKQGMVRPSWQCMPARGMGMQKPGLRQGTEK